MSDELVDAIANMREDEALNSARLMLENGNEPVVILELCRQAMSVVGQRFEACQYFLPELMLAADVVKEITQMTAPLMVKDFDIERSGKVVVGTVQGDIHDIGKNILTMMLDVHGFEVHDLGVDVPAQRFVDAIKEVQPAVVGLSALLTVAYDAMKETIQAITDAGLRQSVKIMIGGATIDERIRTYTNADAYGADAMAAVSLSKEWIGGR